MINTHKFFNIKEGVDSFLEAIKEEYDYLATTTSLEEVYFNTKGFVIAKRQDNGHIMGIYGKNKEEINKEFSRLEKRVQELKGDKK